MHMCIFDITFLTSHSPPLPLMNMKKAKENTGIPLPSLLLPVHIINTCQAHVKHMSSTCMSECAHIKYRYSVVLVYIHKSMCCPVVVVSETIFTHE